MEFKNKLFLAPMDGVTNKEFRDECISAGADVVCTPLISAKDIIANKEKAINEINSIKGQHACGVQIFFCSANEAVLAIKQILNIFHPDYIDLNMCCPSPRVCKTGAGCS
jgi:tRNA-dihydrouridine synthase